MQDRLIDDQVRQAAAPDGPPTPAEAALLDALVAQLVPVALRALRLGEADVTINVRFGKPYKVRLVREEWTRVDTGEGEMTR